MCHSLVMNYGLYKKMEIFVRVSIPWALASNNVNSRRQNRLEYVQRAKPATKREMTQFHSDEYVDFLSRINPGNMNSYIKEQHKCTSFADIRL